MKRFMSIFMFLVVSIFISGTVFAGGIVKFGVDEVRSGAFKSNGDRIIRGIKAAIKETNEKGGLLGKKIELIVEDNQMKPRIAVQKLKKLILEDGVKVIIQGSSSEIGAAISQQMPRYKIIYLDVAAEAMNITGKNFNPYVFRTTLNVGMHFKALAKYFAKKGYKKVFLINQDYSWGYDVAKYYKRFIKKFAPTTQIVGEEYAPVFTKNFSPYISKILASGADYIITGDWGIDLAQLIIQSREMGVTVPFGAAFLDDPGVEKVIGKSALGSIEANIYLLGVNTPRAKVFEERFRKSSEGYWPSFVTAESYIGTKILIKAIEKAKSFNTNAIIKAFEGMTWKGPTGTFTMRKQDHQIIAPVVLGKVVDKTKYYDFPYVKPFEIIPANQVSLTLKESGWKPWK